MFQDGGISAMDSRAHSQFDDALAPPLGRRPRAFTLIELCVVIAICSMIASMLLPAVQQTRATARRIQCCGNMHQIGVAILTYVDVRPNFGRFPNCARQPSVNPLKLPALPTTLAGWTENNPAMFYCPSDLVYFQSEGQAEWQRLNPNATPPTDPTVFFNYGVSYEYMYSTLCSASSPFTPGTRQQVLAAPQNKSANGNSGLILIAADFPVLISIDVNNPTDVDVTNVAYVPAPMQVHDQLGQDGSKNGLYMDGHVDSRYSTQVGAD
jgi:prepilin-type N-terminal cleavage/methylation domain-containing protein